MSRKPKKPNWFADIKIGGTPGKSEPLYDLDQFTDASIREWIAYGRAVRDFHYALFFDLAGQRAARHKELRAALQHVSPVSVSLDGWCRLVNFQFSNQALSPAGSLRWVGQRFNFGCDIEPNQFPRSLHSIQQRISRRRFGNTTVWRRTRELRGYAPMS